MANEEVKIPTGKEEPVKSNDANAVVEPMVTYTEKEVNQILSLINTIPVTGIENALKISNIVMILQHQK